MRLAVFRIARKIFGRKSRYLNYLLSKRYGKKFLKKLEQRSRIDAIEYAYSNFCEAEFFPTRELMWNSIIAKFASSNRVGTYLEFGVFEGYSINFFARNLNGFDFFGFDSFEGLEENWYGHPGYEKGTFSLLGVLPKVEDNVVLIKGWFEATVPNFLQGFTQTGDLIVHLDADTFKPTKFLLEALKSNLKRGTIIIFDEYYGYPNWRAHEYKAFQEFVRAGHLCYRYIAVTPMQVAIEIL